MLKVISILNIRILLILENKKRKLNFKNKAIEI
jgi:hypothetical protein